MKRDDSIFSIIEKEHQDDTTTRTTKRFVGS
jgi:hypothetical protein